MFLGFCFLCFSKKKGMHVVIQSDVVISFFVVFFVPYSFECFCVRDACGSAAEATKFPFFFVPRRVLVVLQSARDRSTKKLLLHYKGKSINVVS